MIDVKKLYNSRFSSFERVRKEKLWKILCREFLQKFIHPTDTIVDLGAGECEFINNIHGQKKIAVDIKEKIEQTITEPIQNVVEKTVEPIKENIIEPIKENIIEKVIEPIKEEIIELVEPVPQKHSALGIFSYFFVAISIVDKLL